MKKKKILLPLLAIILPMLFTIMSLRLIPEYPQDNNAFNEQFFETLTKKEQNLIIKKSSLISSQLNWVSSLFRSILIYAFIFSILNGIFVFLILNKNPGHDS